MPFMKRIYFRRSLFLLANLVCLCGNNFADTTNLPSGVGIEFSFSETTDIGLDLVWTLSLTNSSATSRTCRVTMDANSFGYNGSFLGDVSTSIVTNVIPSGETNTFEMRLSPSEYASWYSKSSVFELTAFVGVEGTDNRWFGRGRTSLIAGTNLLSILPAPPITKGHSVTGTVSYTNPLSSALHNVKVYLTAEEGMSTNSILREDIFDIGTVTTNGLISVFTNYVPGQVGTHNISVVIIADELEEVSGFLDVEVVEP
jgi:hypothetical protein